MFYSNSDKLTTSDIFRQAKERGNGPRVPATYHLHVPNCHPNLSASLGRRVTALVLGSGGQAEQGENKLQKVSRNYGILPYIRKKFL